MPRTLRVRPLVRAVALAAAIGLAVWYLGQLIVRVRFPYPLVVAVLLALTVGRLLVTPLRPPPLLAPPVREDTGSLVFGVPDRPFADVRRWEDRLEWTRGDPEYFGRTVVPTIAALVDERLRQRYGLTRGTDPVRAREILGPGVWEFLDTTQPRRVPSPGALALLVHELEQL